MTLTNVLTTNKAKQHILLVVESLSMAAKFTAMLGRASYVVQHCCDCAAALKQITTQPYALVLVSDSTQNMDVIAVASKLKQLRPALKILTVSGYAHRSIIKQAQATGIVDAFVLNTTDGDNLLTVIAETITLKQEPIKAILSPTTTVKTVQHQKNPDNSLLNDLERRYPGILSGSWAASDTFS
jgi:DNA-binding NtrC family response regulator